MIILYTWLALGFLNISFNGFVRKLEARQEWLLVVFVWLPAGFILLPIGLYKYFIRDKKLFNFKNK
jgi:uncharacterized membrane protein YwzB